MKKTLLFILLLCLNVFCFGSPVKKTLLSLNPNEEILYGEYLSNYRLSSYNFICILYNNSTKKQTLVWNGIKKISADNIELCHVDMSDFTKCSYTYKIGDNAYLMLEGVKYGPYEWVSYDEWYPMMASDYRGSDTHYINKYEFKFRHMGTKYTRDHDGTIYKSSEGKFDFYSPNKSHKLKVDKTKRMVTIDNKNYVIPIPTDAVIEDKEYPSVCLFDDGTCYYTQWGKEDGSWIRYMYYITSSEVREINSKTEYLDLDTHVIKSRNTIQNNEKYPNFWGLNWKYEEGKGSYIAYEFSLQDKTKRHQFYAKWDYDYVLIDGTKYGTSCPISAFYDETANAFCWIVVEGRQIVSYKLSLNR